MNNEIDQIELSIKEEAGRTNQEELAHPRRQDSCGIHSRQLFMVRHSQV